MKEGYSNWRKLDNAALAFPLVTGKNDTRVFRFYCELKENVKPELLQAALEKTMEKYPLFQMVLRKGLFWFYLEHRDIRPIVKEEKKPPCSRLYIPDKKNLLFQVSYYEKRINFEVFHALTDGTGAMHFLQELVSNYLKKAHPEQDLPSLPVTDMSTPGDQEEDSFSQYYSSDIPGNSEKKPRAIRLPGERLLHEDMHITEIVLPVKELHAKAKEYGVSITILITAMFLCSIHEEIPKSRQNRPIALMVPVNLRNYFPSQSMANFFGWIEVGHDFSQTSDFTEILAHVKEQFAAELVEEKIARHMNSYVRLEKNPVIRAVPLEIKKYFLMLGANLGSKSITAVYSNIGILRFPKEYNQYIDRFGIFASTNSMQLCSCSYENEMVLGFTSKLPKDNIQRNFLNMLKKEEIPYTEKTNNFPGCSLKEKKEEQRIVQVFNSLRHDQLPYTGKIGLVLVRRSWLSLRMADRSSCLCQTEEYLKKRDHTVDPGNCYRGSVGQIYRMAWLVSGFCPSIWRSCSTWLYTRDRKSTKAGKRRVSVLPCSGYFCWSGTADPYVSSPDPFSIPICGMHRNQPAGICRNVYF